MNATPIPAIEVINGNMLKSEAVAASPVEVASVAASLAELINVGITNRKPTNNPIIIITAPSLRGFIG